MKTKEELNELRNEVETLNKKLSELTEEELAQVSGGVDLHSPSWDYEFNDVVPDLPDPSRQRSINSTDKCSERILNIQSEMKKGDAP